MDRSIQIELPGIEHQDSSDEANIGEIDLPDGEQQQRSSLLRVHNYATLNQATMMVMLIMKHALILV